MSPFRIHEYLDLVIQARFPIAKKITTLLLCLTGDNVLVRTLRDKTVIEIAHIEREGS
jgi:hypothetical protein